MNNRFVLLVLIVAGILVIPVFLGRVLNKLSTGAPPYDIAFDDPPENDIYAWLKDWKRPEGPAKVALQAGHWKNNELPDELEGLRGNTGSSGGGKSETEVNLAIATQTKQILIQNNILVEILPATIPEKYWADAFVAIHADGNLDSKVSGYKITAPRRDFSGKAELLADLIQASYGKEVDLDLDPNISKNMRGYYAFAWWRHNHAIHPKTPGVILETGFLTNPEDRKIIVNKPEIVARGIAEGILEFLRRGKLI